MAIITISGDLGSGKTSLAKCLVSKMGYETFSAGDVYRKLAADKGISVVELNKIAEKDRSIDTELDGIITEIGKTRDNLILDSRVAWYFIPNSFKIKLVVSSRVAASRVMRDMGTRASEKYKDLEDCAAQLKERKKSEIARFREFYNADIRDDANFDLVINTNEVTPAEVCSTVMEALGKAGIVTKQGSTRYEQARKQEMQGLERTLG